MKLLLVNDDGIEAKGILELGKALAYEHEVIIIAPEGQCSGFSASVKHDIAYKKVETGIKDVNAYAVKGTPVNCTMLGLKYICPDADAVLSGINAGRNAGMDIAYSGTVSAALEAAANGYPALAISLKSRPEMDYSYAASFIKRNLKRLLFAAAPGCTVLNINFPQVEPAKGIQVTRACDTADSSYLMLLPSGEENGYSHLKLSGNPEQPVFPEETDVGAIRRGYISITPLSASRNLLSEHEFSSVKLSINCSIEK